MARLRTRQKDKQRAKIPTFSFGTRALLGITPDTPAEREDKDRQIQEFLERRNGIGGTDQ